MSIEKRFGEIERQQRKMIAWNESVAAGEPVWYKGEFTTITVTKAFMSTFGIAVVELDGYPGVYPLDDLYPVRARLHANRYRSKLKK